MFRKNGSAKKPVSIIDAESGAGSNGAPELEGIPDFLLAEEPATEPPPEPEASSEFTEIAHQTTSVIHQLQKEFEARRSAAKSADTPAPPESRPSRPSPAPLTRPMSEEDRKTAQAKSPVAAPSAPEKRAADRPRDPSPDELERELQQIFGKSPEAGTPGSPTSVLDVIRERVIEGVVDRILQEWQQSGDGAASPLQREVTERLIQRVVQGIGSQAAPKPPATGPRR